MNAFENDLPASNAPLIAYLDARVSERIRRIVDLTLDGRPTWDLCCDHGLIGLWAWYQRKLPELHFVDRTPALMQQLESRLTRHVGSPSIFFHTVDAAKVSLGATPSNVILAGVGFRAADQILSKLDSGSAPHRAIVSVHAEVDLLPPAMLRLGWRLADEVPVEENGRVRVITAWDRD